MKLGACELGVIARFRYNTRTYQDLEQLAAPIHFFSIDVTHCLRL